MALVLVFGGSFPGPAVAEWDTTIDRGKLDEINAELNTHTTKFNDIKDILNHFKPEMDGIWSTNTDILATLRSGSTSSTSYVKALFENTNELEGDMHTIFGHIDGVESKLDSLIAAVQAGGSGTDVSGIESRLDTLNGWFDILSGQTGILNTLHSVVFGVREDTDFITQQLASVSMLLYTIDQDTGALRSDVSDVKTNVTSIKGYVDQVEAKLDTINTTLGSLSVTVDATGVESRLDTANTHLADIESAVESIDSKLDLTSIESYLSQLTEGVNKMDDDTWTGSGSDAGAETGPPAFVLPDIPYDEPTELVSTPFDEPDRPDWHFGMSPGSEAALEFTEATSAPVVGFTVPTSNLLVWDHDIEISVDFEWYESSGARSTIRTAAQAALAVMVALGLFNEFKKA